MTTTQYNQCVDAHSDSVYRFILHNIKNSDDAQDIVQDSFEKLWMHKDTVNFEKVKSYLFTTAYHTMISKIRRDKKQTDFNEVDFSNHIHNKQYSDLKNILNEALDRLPEIQRTVILLRDYEGYDYREIGEITTLTESQVKVYIYRGRQTLKEYLGSVAALI
ncbi:MAG: RNA polymerase sigma factor [Bacteroidia bacterium]|nr:RNA polymerase sigma factor [Bacteroidia bacterium]